MGDVAVFLDRDGTVIEDAGYPRDPDAVRLVPGATSVLRRLQEHGLRLVVVSNQSGIGRGLISQAEADAVNARFVEVLEQEGVRLDATRYCPHAPDAGCDCRKPAPGLLLDVASELGIDLPSSFVVGDRERDLESGRRAGCGHLILLDRTGSRATSDGANVAHDWRDVAALVLGAVTT